MRIIMMCLALAIASSEAACAANTHQTSAQNQPDKTPAYIQNEANVLAPY